MRSNPVTAKRDEGLYRGFVLGAAGCSAQRSLALLVRKALFGPIDFETCRQDKNAKFREAEVAKCRECGTNVGAAFHGTASAIDDKVSGTRLRLGPGLYLSEAFGTASGAVILSALDVARGVETLEANEQDGGSRLGIGQLLEEVTWLDGLRDAPRIRRILRASERNESGG
jgi:hypothetical protein